ncbi:MAG: hypothetical protein EOP84_23165, partial [Verrucomicrobiaceae bacterium]
MVEFPKLDDADRKAMLGDLREVRQAKEWKSHQVKIQALANRANSTLDHAFDIVISCGVESWLRARNRLINWASLSSEERALLADAIFCGFTIFGKRALQDACAIEPEVLSYYRAFLGVPTVPASASDLAAVHAMSPPSGGASVRQASVAQPKPATQMAKVAPEAIGPHVADPSSMEPGALLHSNALGATESNFSKASHVADLIERDAPQSLSQLYLQIGMICQDARASPEVGADPAFRIKDVLDRHLHRLVERNAKLSGEEVSRLIDRYCSAVLHMTVVLDFANSEHRDLVPVLAAAWKKAVISALSEGRQQAWYETNLQQRQHLPALAEGFQEKTSKIAQARAEIESLKSQLAEAKYTARTSLKANETRKQTEISVAQGDLETIRIEAAHYLVPEGRTLDDLMEDESLGHSSEILVDEMNVDAVRSLQVVTSAIDSNADTGIDAQQAPQHATGPTPVQMATGPEVTPGTTAIVATVEASLEAGLSTERARAAGDQVEAARTIRSLET